MHEHLNMCQDELCSSAYGAIIIYGQGCEGISENIHTLCTPLKKAGTTFLILLFVSYKIYDTPLLPSNMNPSYKIGDFPLKILQHPSAP